MEWIQGLLFGGFVVGSVQYFVRNFWDGRSGHHRRMEQFEQERLALAEKENELLEGLITIATRNDMVAALRQERIIEALENIHRDIQKG